jgi:hypothetical protein
VNYHCPTCFRKKDVKAKCRLEAEIKAKKEAELRAKERMEKEKEERGQADEMAGAVFEFFSSLLPDTPEEFADASSPQAGLADSPPLMTEQLIPSPDSITVTTEFGVHEEPSNVTIISAAAPPPAAVHENYQPNASVMAQLVEHMEQIHVENLAAPASSTNNFSIEEDTIEDFIEDDGDDADIDTDDFDAESALIDEFINDGALTPTTTTTTSNL